ncbi:transcription factor NIGT1 [Phoenix dactylifera]|uniref:Transcription factor NIGT1 n=1 Tax=Phoenix dactylifera TaxID=42345 RepID=A0A8B7BP04_PHODC|nr:transcription factor NIGT1 [Phoenix dactylifera]
MDFAERARKCQEYVEALEEERRKIEVFQRELPLCLQLVTQAIESIRMQIWSSEETVTDGPVLEEFIPLKPTSSSTEEEKGGSMEMEQERSEKKPDWLRSVQLWNQETDHSLPKGDPPKRPIAVNAKKIGGAFHPFERGKHAPAAPAAPAASSSTVGGGGGGGVGGEKEKDKEGQSQPPRKARRCWSAELHRRFLHALDQLGGSHAATPKQIREMMKVDGLTNDEVKSHLQKYRLHARRPNLAVQSSSTSNPLAPQFVVVGGLWVPPPDYAAAPAASAAAQPSHGAGAGAGASPNGVYAPVASLPSDLRYQKQQREKPSHSSPTGPLHSEGRCSGDDGATNSASPTTSSSSQTTTASPPY